MKEKIVCPNDDSHKGYEKILLAYEETNKPPARIWVHCDDMKCKRWFQIDFNKRGGAVLKEMPKKYHFDFKKAPTIVRS